MENRGQDHYENKNDGTPVFVLGLLSLVFLIASRGLGLVSFILAIIAVVKGGRERREGGESSLLTWGYMMAIVALVLSAVRLLLLLFVFGFVFTLPILFLL